MVSSQRSQLRDHGVLQDWERWWGVTGRIVSQREGPAPEWVAQLAAGPQCPLTPLAGRPGSLEGSLVFSGHPHRLGRAGSVREAGADRTGAASAVRTTWSGHQLWAERANSAQPTEQRIPCRARHLLQGTCGWAIIVRRERCARPTGLGPKSGSRTQTVGSSL